LPSWLLGGLALAANFGVALLVRPDPNAKAEAALAQITPHDWSVKPGADLMAAALKSAGVDDYRRLAETGDAKAETLMGLIYHVGSTSVKQDQVEATSWLSRAADQQNARALYDLGDVYVSTGGANPERYAEYFRRSADLGNARAEDSLADAYLAGTGVPKDASLAAHWLEQAADQGLTSAEAKLGRLYYNGDLVLRNYDRAATLLQKAANENDPDAEHDLALAYYAGNGVPQNKYEALVLFTKSANQGNVDAEFQLGKMYAEGDGVIADVASGRALITKAANSSSIAAKAWLAAHPLFPSLATPPPLGSLTW
jgi:TPR repeat protein